MRATERRQKVIQRILVGDVDAGEGETPLITLALEEVVISQRNVEQMPRRNAGRIVVVILGSGRWYLQK